MTNPTREEPPTMSATIPARIALARLAEVTCRHRAMDLALRDVPHSVKFAAIEAYDAARAERVRVEVEDARRDAEAAGVTQ